MSEVIRYNIYYELTIHKDISHFLVIPKSHTPILVDYSSSGLLRDDSKQINIYELFVYKYIYTHFYLNVEQQIEYCENFFTEIDAATTLLSVPGDTIGTLISF